MSNYKLWGGIGTLATGILISAIAGWFSIVGLVALFNASAMAIAIMGGSLELGKIVAATWLKAYWSNTAVPILHKGYLLIAVLLLLCTTSLGIFGFLSAAHLEQSAPLGGLEIEVQQYQVQLDQRMADNDRMIKRLDQIDKNISSFLEQGAASRGLSASQNLKKERADISLKIDENNIRINELNTKLAPLKAKTGMVEAKLGPVKYLADAIGYGDNPEFAVQMVIVLIMIPFDPLAMILILSGMITIREWRNDRDRIKPIPATYVIDDDEGEENVDAEDAEAPHDDEPVNLIDVTRGDIPYIAENSTDETISGKPDTLTTQQIIDLLEQHPSLVNDLIDTVRETQKTSVSDITGATVD